MKFGLVEMSVRGCKIHVVGGGGCAGRGRQRRRGRGEPRPHRACNGVGVSAREITREHPQNNKLCYPATCCQSIAKILSANSSPMRSWASTVAAPT